MSKKLINAIADMKEAEALELAREMLEGDADPMAILDASKDAMDLIGQRYEKGVYFLPELMLAGEMMTQITDLLKPVMAEMPQTEHLGKVLMGTVQGDIHDIGKNIVSFMLDANGFDVRDLGVDVAPQKFVEEVRDFQPQVVGLSGFLALAFDAMKETIDAIQAAALRDQVKIMIGGGQISEDVRTYTGADAYGNNAMAGVSLAKKWVGAK